MQTRRALRNGVIVATDNILTAVERLEKATATLERILYGDPPARPHGLLVEFDKMNQRLGRIEQQVKNRRPHVLIWLAGYVSFLIGNIFFMLMLHSQVSIYDEWRISAELSFWLAVMFLVGALVMFLVGFGWFTRE